MKGIAAIKEQSVMHRDLKLANIMVHFPILPADACIDPKFDLKGFLETAKLDSKSVVCKIADLGFARKLGED